ncbi:hypothetical protein D3C72_1777430 [compost metagenome]
MHYAEIGVVNGPAFSVLINQIDQAAIRRTHRCQFTLVGPDQTTVGLAMECHGASQGLGAILDPNGRGTQGRTMAFKKVVGKGIGFSIENQVDITLAQQADILRTVRTCTVEAQALQPISQLGPESIVHGELKKLDAVVGTGRRRSEQRVIQYLTLLLQPLTGFLLKVQQRTQAIGGVGSWWRGAETIVEDFQ